LIHPSSWWDFESLADEGKPTDKLLYGILVNGLWNMYRKSMNQDNKHAKEGFKNSRTR